MVFHFHFLKEVGFGGCQVHCKVRLVSLPTDRKWLPGLTRLQLESALLQNRMFTISADIASRFGHRILGVTAQCFDCGKVIHRVLAIMPLTNSHTAINIANEIKLVLAVYDREIFEVYSFGVDNAINMVNVIYLLSETQ